MTPCLVRHCSPGVVAVRERVGHAAVLSQRAPVAETIWHSQCAHSNLSWSSLALPGAVAHSSWRQRSLWPCLWLTHCVCQVPCPEGCLIDDSWVIKENWLELSASAQKGCHHLTVHKLFDEAGVKLPLAGVEAIMDKFTDEALQGLHRSASEGSVGSKVTPPAQKQAKTDNVTPPKVALPPSGAGLDNLG